MEGKDDEDGEEQEGLLPDMKQGENLGLREMVATQRFDRPAPRYTEASLVKKLEELGIGRPSTYAATISTVQRKNYVVKEDREGTKRAYRILTLADNAITDVTATENAGAEKQKLFPTDIGMVVNDFLVEHFPTVVDLNFTAKVEEEFDVIAEGKENWREMLARFYKPFHETIGTVQETAERATGSRQLGIDPASGKPIIARIGRFGPMIQIGTAEDEDKPRFASLRKLDKRDPNGTGVEVPVDLDLQAKADTFINPIYDEFNSPMYFNGDDAFFLVKNGNTIIDLIGRSGEDPGNGWWVPGDPLTRWWTVDQTLIRKSDIQHGVFENPAVFDPSLEWDSLPNNTFDNLGAHLCVCGTVSVNEIKQHEFSIFPNPVLAGQFAVRTSYDMTAISLYSSDGRLIIRKNIFGEQQYQNVEFPEAESGLYFIEIDFADGTTAHRKIISR